MYNKLFTKIVDSSIWLEPTPTRLLWMMLIAVMDEDGFCQFASAANVAHRARLSVEETEQALAKLESPDANSGDGDNEGRRIEKVPGGWIVLNAGKYRKLVTREVEREKTRLRVAAHREKQRAATQGNAGVTQCNGAVTPSEASAVSDAPTNNPSPRAKRADSPLSWHGLPSELDTPGFREAWEQYVSYRRKARIKPLLPESVREQWRKLATHGPDVARLAIGETIGNGWQGIFPEKIANGSPTLRGREAEHARAATIHAQTNKRAGI